MYTIATRRIHVSSSTRITRTVLHDEELEGTNEANDLDKTERGNGIGPKDSGEAIGIRIETVAVQVNVAIEVDASAGDDLTKESKLADTAVLELDVTETLETFLIDIIKHAKRIPETNLLGEDVEMNII